MAGKQKSLRKMPEDLIRINLNKNLEVQEHQMAFPEVLPIIGKDEVHCLAHRRGDKTVPQFSGKRQFSRTLLMRKKVNP